MNQQIIILIMMLFAASPLFPGDLKSISQSADSIVKTALRDSTGYKLLESLCQIGPRLSGSEQSVKAALFSLDAMKKQGYDTAWLQPITVPKWVRGTKERAILKSGKGKKLKPLSVASLGGSIGTNGSISAGVIEINSFNEMKSKAGDIKDKIVFYNVKWDQGLVNTFNGYGRLAGYRVFGGIEAAKYGAKGFIVRSITTRNDNTPHTGVTYYNDTLPKIPGLAIGIIDADFLSNYIKKDPSVKVTLEMNCYSAGDVPSYNVIGEIKGKGV